jgi:hypothetical protein
VHVPVSLMDRHIQEKENRSVFTGARSFFLREVSLLRAGSGTSCWSARAGLRTGVYRECAYVQVLPDVRYARWTLLRGSASISSGGGLSVRLLSSVKIELQVKRHRQ